MNVFLTDMTASFFTELLKLRTQNPNFTIGTYTVLKLRNRGLIY